ncbi:MAG: transglutaminase-like domain-containing protein [Pirellulales bacterium]|nr:transglutaminase-like domain-containing protein [Pirellulales bacterium]
MSLSFSHPVYCRPEAFRLFRQEILHLDDNPGLFRAAFTIALHEHPEASLAEVETTIEKLADTVKSRAVSLSTPALLAHLHDVLFEVYGLRGNVENYYDPSNSYVSDVLRTRLGIPISLVLIYKRVAECLGLVVHGVNTPGHFLAEVASDQEHSDGPMYVDPFFGGNLLNLDEGADRIAQATGHPPAKPLQLQHATHRQWLTRMLTNLQAAFAALGQERDVYAMQELQTLLQTSGNNPSMPN